MFILTKMDGQNWNIIDTQKMSAGARIEITSKIVEVTHYFIGR